MVSRDLGQFACGVIVEEPINNCLIISVSSFRMFFLDLIQPDKEPLNLSFALLCKYVLFIIVPILH